MYGYVMEGGRASLTMRQIGGVWFAVAVLPRSGFLAAYRRGRLLRRLRRQGIVRCVLPSSLTAEAERYGLHGVAVEGLRLALLPQLLDMQGDLRRKTAVLRAEYVSPAVYRAAAVLAAKSGTVTWASWNGGYGNCIIISHGNGNSTLYGHLSGYNVSTDQQVTQGQVIGYSGNTGNSTGPHLHFGIIENNSWIDPLNYLTGWQYYG